MRAPSEAFECRAFARWLSRQNLLLFSKIPIGDTTLAGPEGAKLRSLGVRPGVPDFVIVHIDTGNVLWIEMKRERGGKLSYAQSVWIHALHHTRALIAYGYQQAKQLTKEYYRNDRTNDPCRDESNRSKTPVLRSRRKNARRAGSKHPKNARRRSV